MVALTGELLLMNLLQHNKKQEFYLSKLTLYQLSNSDFNSYVIIYTPERFLQLSTVYYVLTSQ